MFELLDHARREAARRTILKPRYAIFAPLSVLMVGVEAGILIGRRDWYLLDWLNVGFNGILFFVIFAPLFRELYNFFRDREIE